ncbi:MAG: S9 family peptidase [Spirochaetia bacterium]|jgi:dienelactone hydrolase|nr:S9 family peptidase [Spirochaetia bacterium]
MYNKIRLEDFLKNHILTNLKINKTKTFGLYFDYTLDQEKNVYRKDVFLLELRELKIKKIDLSFEPEDFRFVEDEIIFKHFSDDNTIFYSYNPVNGSVSEMMTIPFTVDDFAFNESKLFFTMEVQRSDTNAAVQCSQNGPFYQEGRGIVGKGVIGLFQSDLDGKDITMVSSLDMDIDKTDFDFDNNRIIFTAYAVKNLKPIVSSIYFYNLESESMKLLNDRPFRISYIKSMTEDTVVFFGVDMETNSRNDNPQIYKVDTETGESGVLGKLPDKSNEHPGIVTDSFFSTSLPVQRYRDELYFKLVARDRDMLYRINLAGDCDAVETGMKIIGSFNVIDNGIVLIGLKDLKLSEIYFSDNSGTRQVSHYNQWVDELLLSKAEKMSVFVDDVEIDGYVFPPVGAQENHPCPAVLLIHGGPKMIYSDIFAHDIQLLCGNGYYVFCANPMGSDGRGDSFANIRGHFGELPHKQLMAFTDKVLDNYPSIDRDRLGVTGGSYGGYMTNYIISHTNRFKAAVAERGISNLMTSFTSSDIGYQFIFEYMGNEATPWTDPVVLMEASPVYQAHRVTTPTLFIHGKNDYRCHYSESINMFSALNYHGVETRMCLFDEETHGLVVRGKPQNKKRRYSELLSWFDRFLKRGMI